MEENKSGGLLQALLFGGGSGGGASSLADLSDVEIDPISLSPGDLLSFNDNDGKWKRVSPAQAILHNNQIATPGAVILTDTSEFNTAPPIVFTSQSQQAELLVQIITMAVRLGEIQIDNQDASTLRSLIDEAIIAVYYNTSLVIAACELSNLVFSLSLVSANQDFAVWSGTMFNSEDLKVYRITIVFYCPVNAESASIMAKAEELMTFTEPT